MLKGSDACRVLEGKFRDFPDRHENGAAGISGLSSQSFRGEHGVRGETRERWQELSTKPRLLTKSSAVRDNSAGQHPKPQKPLTRYEQRKERLLRKILARVAQAERIRKADELKSRKPLSSAKGKFLHQNARKKVPWEPLRVLSPIQRDIRGISGQTCFTLPWSSFQLQVWHTYFSRANLLQKPCPSDSL
jgi:hypothetical protein